MATLFESASSDPNLLTQVVDAVNTAASQQGVSFDDDAVELLQFLSQNAAFKQTAQNLLSKLATSNGLQFTAETLASIADATATLTALEKFTSGKDNPTQIPVGTPIALLFIAAALIFVPTIFSTAGTTIFGAETIAQVEGVAPFP